MVLVYSEQLILNDFPFIYSFIHFFTNLFIRPSDCTHFHVNLKLNYFPCISPIIFLHQQFWLLLLPPYRLQVICATRLNTNYFDPLFFFITWFLRTDLWTSFICIHLTMLNALTKLNNFIKKIFSEKINK